jgi:nucleotide-binding universal stress UspA family protein
VPATYFMKILVPTDFSSNARTALDYAARLAVDLNASLIIAHIIRPPGNSRAVLSETKAIEKNVVLELHELQMYLCHTYGLKTTIKVGIGVIADEIVKLSTVHFMNLIVMATHGNGGLQKTLFGSNTAEVINKSKIAVVALPPDAVYRKPERIVFAMDHQSDDIEDMQEIAHFAEFFNATISAVHVVNRFTDEDLDFDIHAHESFSDLVHSRINYAKIGCDEFQHEDVAEGIKCFVEAEEADILALSSSHRNLLKKLFQKTLTHEFLFQIDTPLLTFHAGVPERIEF